MSTNVKIKFYAVRAGLNPGIYRSWEECRLQTEGFSQAEFKGFRTLEDARDYLEGQRQRRNPGLNRRRYLQSSPYRNRPSTLEAARKSSSIPTVHAPAIPDPADMVSSASRRAV